MTAFTAVALLLISFAAPETSYNRPAIYETDITSSDNLPITEERLAADVIATAKEPGSDISSAPADKEITSVEMHKDQSPIFYWPTLFPRRGWRIAGIKRDSSSMPKRRLARPLVRDRSDPIRSHIWFLNPPLGLPPARPPYPPPFTSPAVPTAQPSSPFPRAAALDEGPG